MIVLPSSKLMDLKMASAGSLVTEYSALSSDHVATFSCYSRRAKVGGTAPTRAVRAVGLSGGGDSLLVLSTAKSSIRQCRFASVAGKEVLSHRLCNLRPRRFAGAGNVSGLRNSERCSGRRFLIAAQRDASRDTISDTELPEPSHPSVELKITGGDRGTWKQLRPTGALLGLAGLVAGLNLEGPGSVLEAMGVLALIVTVHECGHFMAARLQNIHVTKFSIGFGPILTKFQGKNVEYTLRAIPLGGFVAFPDDDPDSDFAPDDPDLLKNRPILDRAIVISAGVIANAIFAYTVLFTQVNTVGVLEQTFGPGVAVPDVIQNSAAARGGLQSGDIVLAVNGHPLMSNQASVIELVEAIKQSGGQGVQFDLLRGEQTFSLEIVSDKASDGSGRIGVQLAPNAESERVKAKDLGEATSLASEEFMRLLFTVVDGLKQIVFNFSQTAERVSGPVAIVAVGAEVARSDAAGLFQFAAIVNLNLAVVNILPLPALDGGYLALLCVEALRGGRKLPSGVEQGIMSSGLLLLLGVGVVLMVRDTLNLGFLDGIL